MEYKGLHIPIAMGWLPDKTAMSYYVFLWLVLSAFKERSEAIHESSSKLKLRKVKCDFEVEQGWANILSSKDSFYLGDFGREFKCPLDSLIKLEPMFSEEKGDSEESQFTEKLEKLPNNTTHQVGAEGIKESWEAEVSVQMEEIPGPYLSKKLLWLSKEILFFFTLTKK